MSPLGKSGNYHMNPHQMHAKGDAPDAAENASPDKENTRHEHGKHQHHITKHEDGTYTSMHTHPDGNVEHMEHPHFHHAIDHMASKFGESSDLPENEHDEKPVEGRSNYDEDDSALESLYDQE